MCKSLHLKEGCAILKLFKEKGNFMSEEIKWEIVEESVAQCLGGTPSYRLVRRLTGYVHNILRAAGWPAVDGVTYDLVVHGVCNAAITGKEEL